MVPFCIKFRSLKFCLNYRYCFDRVVFSQEIFFCDLKLKMSFILRNLAGAGEIEPSPGYEIKGFLKFSKL